jgi:hypothetical protein
MCAPRAFATWPGRARQNGNAGTFPGVLGPWSRSAKGGPIGVGMAVFVTAEYEGTVRAGLGVQRSAILDMWGDGALSSPFSALNGLVLNLRLAKGLSELTAHTIIQRAAFETAKRLAEVTVGSIPGQIEVFELGGADAALPRVLLIQGCLTDAGNPHSGVGYFGLPIRDSLATTVHPNEFLDGAFSMSATRAGFLVTWDWHPLLLGLYHDTSKGQFLGRRPGTRSTPFTARK